MKRIAQAALAGLAGLGLVACTVNTAPPSTPVVVQPAPRPPAVVVQPAP